MNPGFPGPAKKRGPVSEDVQPSTKIKKTENSDKTNFASPSIERRAAPVLLIPFSMDRIDNFAKPFPKFRRPVEVGYMSICLLYTSDAADE